MMKKFTTKLTGAFVVALLLGASLSVSAQDKPKGQAWPTPDASAKMKNPVKSDDASIASGKEVYTAQCKSCHGAKGLGDGPKAEKIDISCGDFSAPEFAKLTDGELFYKVTEGRKPMPSFKEKLSDNERWAVVNYMRTLAKK